MKLVNMGKALETVCEGRLVDIAGRTGTIQKVYDDGRAQIGSRFIVPFTLNAEQLAAFGYKAITMEEALEGQSYPSVGDTIYIGTSLFMSHGRDDFIGGRATVARVSPGMSAGRTVPFVEVEERPGWSSNWEVLAQRQEKLREQFGDKRAHADPDMRPEFNEI